MGPWTHDSLPINFTLLVDDFGGKYSGRVDALHLKSALEDNYKVTTDWEVKMYIEVALKWYYEKDAVQISMPGYVRAALHSFQQETSKYHRIHHTPIHNPSMKKQSDDFRESTN